MEIRGISVQIRLLARGKVNLALDVLGRRPNGYHDVAMVMQSISLADELTLEEMEEGIHVTSSNPLLPTGPDNLAYRAAEALMKLVGKTGGIHIHIQKMLPVAAGLGGGSADAAGVLYGLDRLWNLRLSSETLAKLALQLGADVSFCLSGGTALAEGVGEILTPLPSLPGRWLVLVKLPLSVSTARVYQAWDRLASAYHPDVYRVAQLIREEAEAKLPDVWGNALEEVTFKLYPEVKDLFLQLQDRGLPVRMTGSGPTLFLWGFADEITAVAFVEQIRNGGIWADAVTTADRGIDIIEITN